MNWTASYAKSGIKASLQTSGQHVINMSRTKQGADAINSSIGVLLRVLWKQFVRQQCAVWFPCHNVCEGSATVYTPSPHTELLVSTHLANLENTIIFSISWCISLLEVRVSVLWGSKFVMHKNSVTLSPSNQTFVPSMRRSREDIWAVVWIIYGSLTRLCT